MNWLKCCLYFFWICFRQLESLSLNTYSLSFRQLEYSGPSIFHVYLKLLRDDQSRDDTCLAWEIWSRVEFFYIKQGFCLPRIFLDEPRILFSLEFFYTRQGFSRVFFVLPRVMLMLITALFVVWYFFFFYFFLA